MSAHTIRTEILFLSPSYSVYLGSAAVYMSFKRKGKKNPDVGKEIKYETEKGGKEGLKMVWTVDVGILSSRYPTICSVVPREIMLNFLDSARRRCNFFSHFIA